MREPGVRERLKSYGLIERDRRAPAVDADAVEATFAWESTVLGVVVVSPRRALTAKDLGVPASLDEGVVLARAPAKRGGAPRLYLPDGTEVPEGARAWIRVGGTRATLRLDRVRSERATPRAAPADQDARASYGIATIAHALLFAALFSLARVIGPASAEDDRARIDAIRAYLAAAGERATVEAPKELTEGDDAAGESGANGGDVGQRAKGEEGELGNPAHAPTHAAYQPHEARPATARATDFDPAKDGMIALLSDADRAQDEPSPFADRDVPGAMGNMWNTRIDDAFGVGSLGLSGVGEGGGGAGAGVGVDRVGTLGHGRGGEGLEGGQSGTCDETCKGALGYSFAHGSVSMTMGHIARGPVLRCGWTEAEIARGADCVTVVNGRLPPEAIQRVVRANFGRMRACYERGLSKNPSLEGRVAVSFVIDRAGAVSAATLAAGSSMPDAEVSACVVSAYTRMSFPEPEGGIVTVVYPITFSPV